jgi:hypothetical protein
VPSGEAVGKYVPAATQISTPLQLASMASCKFIKAFAQDEPLLFPAVAPVLT